MPKTWIVFAGLVLLTGCGASPGRVVRPDSPRLEPADAAACEASKTHLRPLLVEWSSGDRAALEAQSSRNVIVVRYAGCDLEILRGCSAPGKYEYIGITPKQDQVSIRDRNELYAELPLGAAKLGGQLETEGSLSLDMTTAGILESRQSGVRVDQLQGECDGATHVVAAMTVGAFELESGAKAHVGAEATVLGTGAGGDSESEKSVLTRDGNRLACKSGDATSAPEGCSGILRLELLAVGAHRPLCKETERYNGERCEPLPAPIPVSDERRAQLEQACKLGASVACKLLKVVGTR